ncbi:MAG: hypothetical protein HC902_13730 [Calothrix sp. SM1_5_4]|nr:hypothetical protein [Calothrix sp. SM1_5_4]
MCRQLHETIHVTRLFEVTAVNSGRISLLGWDIDNLAVDIVFTGAEFETPPRVGEIYLATLEYDDGIWRIHEITFKMDPLEPAVGEDAEDWEDWGHWDEWDDDDWDDRRI